MFGSNIECAKVADRKNFPATWNMVSVTQGQNPVGFRIPKKLPILQAIRLAVNPDTDNDIRWMENDLKSILVTNLSKYGLATNSIKAVDCPYGNQGRRSQRANIVAALDNAFGRFKTPPTLLLVMVTSKDTSIYSDVKWWGDCKKGVPTICVTYDVLSQVVVTWDRRAGKSKPNPTIAGNLA